MYPKGFVICKKTNYISNSIKYSTTQLAKNCTDEKTWYLQQANVRLLKKLIKLLTLRSYNIKEYCLIC